MLEPGDIAILRKLAAQIAETANSDIMSAKRDKWIRHNDDPSFLDPIILFETQGMADEFLPAASLMCRSPEGRAAEHSLRMRLHHANQVADDTVLDAEFRLNWHFKIDGWKTKAAERTSKDIKGRSLAHVPVPVLDNDKSISTLLFTQYHVDTKSTIRELSMWENVFGDILNVRLRGSFWWTLGMTWDFIRLTGMERFLVMPYEDPDEFHAIMRFLTDEQLRMFKFLEAGGFLTLNNRNDYIGSGSYGYTNKLLSMPDGQVCIENLWGLLESQESIGMSASMFEEFIFPYQLEIAGLLGRCYYGCCEPVHERIHIINRIKNLSSVSVSPWCDMERLREGLKDGCIASLKPNPAYISTGFAKEELSSHAKLAKQIFGGVKTEFIMKDVHTVEKDLSRINRWINLMHDLLLS